MQLASSSRNNNTNKNYAYFCTYIITHVITRKTWRNFLPGWLLRFLRVFHMGGDKSPYTVLLRKTLSPAFFNDSLKFEFFGTSFNKSSLIKKI
ncbi:hypothetical protein BpHYR1_021163 [Brachionus plicatilis]|uniref:Uncharacterized protein n=1 Tax=Brachionus plicatilis TaxID=10195 RepID=A0A3M7PKH5_BRAPC|nr:hypothetical protein BpHYR1_021163 [Brachionus plicatilis]